MNWNWQRFMGVVLIALTVMPAQAFYNPTTGRWLSRDPVGEPGFEVVRRVQPSKAAGGSNRYLFVQNTPLNHIDRLGLDIWIIKDSSGAIRHRYAVGNNADGTYWVSDFGPDSTSLIGRLCCKGTINFFENSIFDPKNLGSGFVIERHVKAHQMATDEAKRFAKRAVEHQEKCCKRTYSPGSYDCRNWADEVANEAQRHQNLCEICKRHAETCPTCKPDAEKKTEDDGNE